jgi:hypothetical protein
MNKANRGQREPVNGNINREITRGESYSQRPERKSTIDKMGADLFAGYIWLTDKYESESQDFTKFKIEGYLEYLVDDNGKAFIGFMQR